MLYQDQAMIEDIIAHYEGFTAESQHYAAPDGTSITEYFWHGQTSKRWMRMLMYGNRLVVTGDGVNAIFTLTEQASLESLSQYDLSYLFGKLTCIDSEENGTCYSVQAALDTIEEWAECVRENTDTSLALFSSLRNQLVTFAKEAGTCQEWNEFLSQCSTNILYWDSYGLEALCGAGKAYDQGVLQIYVALRLMRMTLLTAKAD